MSCEPSVYTLCGSAALMSDGSLRVLNTAAALSAVETRLIAWATRSNAFEGGDASRSGIASATSFLRCAIRMRPSAGALIGGPERRGVDRHRAEPGVLDDDH